MTKSKNIRKHVKIEQRNEIVGFHETNPDFSQQIRWISGVTDLCQRKYGDIVKTKGPITKNHTFLKCL